MDGWETVGGRLKWAIMEHQKPEGKRRGTGLLIHRLNQRAQNESGDSEASFPGATYPTIGSYLRDKDPTAPPVEFLSAVAQELGIDRGWLAFGEGYPTKDHADRAMADSAVTALTTISAIVHATGSATMEVRPGDRFQITAMPPGGEKALHDTLTHIYDALAVSDRSGGQPWVPAILEVWRRMGSGVEGIQQDMKALGEALAAPLRALGLDPEDMEAGEVDAYVFGMVPTLLQLASIVRRQGVGEEG